MRAGARYCLLLLAVSCFGLVLLGLGFFVLFVIALILFGICFGIQFRLGPLFVFALLFAAASCWSAGTPFGIEFRFGLLFVLACVGLLVLAALTGQESHTDGPQSVVVLLLAWLTCVARRSLPLRSEILFGTRFGLELWLGLLIVFACVGLWVLAALTGRETRTVVGCCVNPTSHDAL